MFQLCICTILFLSNLKVTFKIQMNDDSTLLFRFKWTHTRSESNSPLFDGHLPRRHDVWNLFCLFSVLFCLSGPVPVLGDNLSAGVQQLLSVCVLQERRAPVQTLRCSQRCCSSRWNSLLRKTCCTVNTHVHIQEAVRTAPVQWRRAARQTN